MDRLGGQYAKDQKYTRLLESLGAPFWLVLEQRPGLCLESQAALQYRWMLEELRVSLYAQSLGTRLAVSEKRLQEQWQGVLQWIKENPH